MPVLVLMLWSIYAQLTEPTGAMHGFVALRRLLPPWELFYNMFAEWMFGFTWLSVPALVPTLVIPLLAFSRRWERPMFFGPVALFGLWGLYFATPYVATNWFHVNSRFIGFLWIAMLLRVPDRLDRRLAGLLAMCALLYSAAMGVDYVRLDAATRFLHAAPLGFDASTLELWGPLLHGGADRLSDVSSSRELHARAGAADTTLIVYDGLYHEILNEPERDQVLADVTAWLDARV